MRCFAPTEAGTRKSAMQKPSAVTGMCGLCKAEGVALCYSDLLPKAVIRWVRLSADSTDGDPNPIFVTKSTTKPLNFRVAEYFLCPNCEGRLNRCGETWTLKRAYRGNTKFPLRDSISHGPRLISLQKADLIDARGLLTVDLEKLIYFAVNGTSGKACARKWWALDHPTQLEFGPYEERFRQFLLAEQPFPDSAALLINVSADPQPHIGVIYPYGGGRVQRARQYRFAIPGHGVLASFGANPCRFSGHVCVQLRHDLSVSGSQRNVRAGHGLADIVMYPAFPKTEFVKGQGLKPKTNQLQSVRTSFIIYAGSWLLVVGWLHLDVEVVFKSNGTIS